VKNVVEEKKKAGVIIDIVLFLATTRLIQTSSGRCGSLLSFMAMRICMIIRPSPFKLNVTIPVSDRSRLDIKICPDVFSSPEMR
jgi:hypothetical protein